MLYFGLICLRQSASQILNLWDTNVTSDRAQAYGRGQIGYQGQNGDTKQICDEIILEVGSHHIFILQALLQHYTNTVVSLIVRIINNFR